MMGDQTVLSHQLKVDRTWSGYEAGLFELVINALGAALPFDHVVAGYDPGFPTTSVLVLFRPVSSGSKLGIRAP